MRFLGRHLQWSAVVCDTSRASESQQNGTFHRIVRPGLYLSQEVLEGQGGGDCLGPLMGGPQCLMSILRNGKGTCWFHLLSQMSYVKFKKL